MTPEDAQREIADAKTRRGCTAYLSDAQEAAYERDFYGGWFASHPPLPDRKPELANEPAIVRWRKQNQRSVAA
jgi:hypothetical protein